jgi:membrane fusion protein
MQALKTHEHWLSLLIIVVLVGLSIASVNLELPRIVRASGYIYSTSSSWKAVPPQLAVLVELQQPEKSIVKKGQVIAELSAERFAHNHSIEFEQAQLAQKKLTLGRQELQTISNSASQTARATSFQIESLRRELVNSEGELELINLRLADIYQQQSRQRELVKEGFISQEALEIKNSELLRLKGEKSASERQQLSLKREIEKQTTELSMTELRSQSQKAQLSREMTTAQQEYNEHLSKRIQLVSAIDGIVTQVSAQPGQMVRPDIPLLTVIPLDGGIEVILLLPSRSIGFVREGQRVSVRYQAYPHEHYGRHFGTVREISRIALPPQEVAQHIRVEEPVYTVRVKLPENYLTYQDKKLPITPGMVVEADVELDRLKIYQWLLEPLYRLGGRV